MNEVQLLERSRQLLSRVAGFTFPDPIRHTVCELRRMPRWEPWANKPGIYYFVHQGTVVYVGRALPSQMLGNRVGYHITDCQDPDREALREPDTLVGVLPFPDKDWHWIAALECWLLDESWRPKLNKRF